MFEPRPEQTPLHNKSLTDRCPWKCEQCGAVWDSLDDPGAKVSRGGVVLRVCMVHVADEQPGGHDGE